MYTMYKIVMFGLIWIILLILILPAVAPIEYTAEEDSRDAYILTPPEQIQQGDTIQYWDTGTQSFRVSTVHHTTSIGYLVTAPSESGMNTTVVPAYSVVGTPITVGDKPLTVPLVGGIVPLTQAIRSLILVVFLAVSVVIGAILRERLGTHRRRVLRVHHVAIPLIGIVILSTLVITPITASTYQIAYEASDEPADSANEEWTEKQITVRYQQPLLSHLIVETPTDDPLRWEQDGEVIRITLKAPTDSEYTTSLSIFPYLAVLPRSIIRSLHAIHPVVAILGASSVVSGPLLAVYGLFIDGSNPAPRPFQTLIE
jgi:hypothetical protein